MDAQECINVSYLNRDYLKYRILAAGNRVPSCWARACQEWDNTLPIVLAVVAEILVVGVS